MAESITGAQLHVLRALDRLLRERRVPPSIHELCAAAGRGYGCVYGHRQALIGAGLVTAMPSMPRSMQITDKGRRVLRKHARQKETR